MITNKSAQQYRLHQAPRQRLGDKETFTTLTPNQNGKYVRYFSSIDAEIYFGDIFIDEVNQIAWQVQQNAQPIYGYNSYIYDDIAVGARIINGQFTVNFTKSGYLYEVIDTLKNIEVAGSTVKRSRIDTRNPLWITPNSLSNIKAGFDLYVSFGDGRQSPAAPGSSVTVLKNVVLTACSTALDASGTPIAETYSFIGRDIDFLVNDGEITDLQEETQEVEITEDPIIGLSFKNTREAGLLTFHFKKNIRVRNLKFKHADVTPIQTVIDDSVTSRIDVEYTHQVKTIVKNAIYQSKLENRLDETPIACTITYEEAGIVKNWQDDLIITEYTSQQ